VTNSDTLEVIETATYNGIFDNYVMLGGRVMISDTEVFALETNSFALHDGIQISPQDYYAKLKKIFDEKVSAPAFCQMIALA